MTPSWTKFEFLAPIKGAGWIVVAMLVAAAFVFGYCTKPTNSASVAAVLAESLRVEAQDLAKAADARATAAIAATNRAIREKNAANVARLAALRTSNAYRDSVRILSDSVVGLVDSLGHQVEATIPPQVIARMRSDSAALHTAGLTIASYQASEREWVKERAAGSDALTAQRAVAAAYARELPLKEKAAYERGVKTGRTQVIATVGAGAAAYVGVRLAFR